MGEGITVTKLMDDEDISENDVLVSEDKRLRECAESPYIQLSFWEYGVCKKPHWNWWWRLKIAWYVFRNGAPWPDQVIMKATHAKSLAHHILYVVRKAEKEIKKTEVEESRPYLCVQHGGSAAGEAANKKFNVACPKCLDERQFPGNREIYI